MINRDGRVSRSGSGGRGESGRSRSARGRKGVIRRKKREIELLIERGRRKLKKRRKQRKRRKGEILEGKLDLRGGEFGKPKLFKKVKDKCFDAFLLF